MIQIMSNLTNTFSRDEIQEYQKNQFKHSVKDDGKIDIYFPFTRTINIDKEGGGTLLENLKAHYGEYTDDAIGYDNNVIYTGSIGTGVRGIIPYLGSRQYTMIVVMTVDIHNYHLLLERSKLIPLVNSVRYPTQQLINDLYNGKTLYSAEGLDRHLHNVIQINWNNLDGIKYELSYIKSSVNQPVSKKRLDYSKKIKEVNELYGIS